MLFRVEEKLFDLHFLILKIVGPLFFRRLRLSLCNDQGKGYCKRFVLGELKSTPWIDFESGRDNTFVIAC